jgi:SAM-dependent methyltransferase
LPDAKFPHVLGFGAAYGDELLPILPRVETVTIVDPSDAFRRDAVHGVPATYVKPAPDGSIPLPADSFDLITCFGVLHCIANISFVVGELASLLKPGGYMALREPIVSMGDWRRPRGGLTKRERGCPLPILRRIVQDKGLTIPRESFCAFPLTTRIFRFLKGGVYNSHVATRFDAALAAAFAWNVNYHPRTVLQRFRPTAVFMVLRKPAPSNPGGGSLQHGVVLITE